MRENSDLTRSLPSEIKQASSTLQLSGQIGFWVQIILGVISGVVFLFASASLLGPGEKTQGIEFGVFAAFAGLVLLGVAIYFSVRYSSLGKQLRNPDPRVHPRRANVLQLIKIGLIVNLAGMLMAILGAAALAGIVLLKSLTIPQGTLTTNPGKFVNSIDLLVIQANTNAIMAHFSGIVNSLWLLDRISK